VRKADNLPTSCVVMKSGSLYFLETFGPVQACNGTALPLEEIRIRKKERKKEEQKACNIIQPEKLCPATGVLKVTAPRFGYKSCVHAYRCGHRNAELLGTGQTKLCDIPASGSSHKTMFSLHRVFAVHPLHLRFSTFVRPRPGKSFFS